jgi:hypothetical protein
MWPSGSMMKPVPAPRRGPSRSRSSGRSNGSWVSGAGTASRRRVRPLPRTVASMFTTAGFSRSATSAKEATADAATVAFARRAGTTVGSGAEIARAGIIEPATISPTRKAIVAVSDTVTTTNRRFIATL